MAIRRVPGGASMWAKTRSGKRIRFGSTNETPRSRARSFGSWFHVPLDDPHGRPRPLRKGWQPKKRRRKLGARRKVSIIKTLFRWVKVPTGKVSRQSARPRRRRRR